MQVKFLSGPRAGQIAHVERSQSTQLLIDAGMLEVIPDAPPALHFGIGTAAPSDWLYIFGTFLHRTEVYAGPPEGAKAFFDKVGMKGLPDSLVETFAHRAAAKTAQNSHPIPGKQITYSK